MNKRTSWDFRESQEISMSNFYENDGFIVENADKHYLDLLKFDLERAYLEFIQTHSKKPTSLEDAHQVVSHSESNELRLYIMKVLCQGTSFHKNYYNSAKQIIHSLCGNELAMQKRPGLSINLPKILMMCCQYMQIPGMEYLHLSSIYGSLLLTALTQCVYTFSGETSIRKFFKKAAGSLSLVLTSCLMNFKMI